MTISVKKASYVCFFYSLGVFGKDGDLKEDSNRRKAEDKQHKTDKSSNNVSYAIIRFSLFASPITYNCRQVDLIPYELSCLCLIYIFCSVHA